MEEVVIKLKVADIQLLNNLISNSVPTVPFATVTQFVTNISEQIQSQLKAYQSSLEKEDSNVVEPESKLTKA